MLVRDASIGRVAEHVLPKLQSLDFVSHISRRAAAIVKEAQALNTHQKTAAPLGGRERYISL